MEFTFHISGYDDPALDGEAAQALEQRLAAYSRAVMPKMWSVTDKLNARAAKGPGRDARRKKNRIYGVLLLAMAVFVLVPGLTEPRIPALVCAGVFALAASLFCLWLSRAEKPAGSPTSCREEAAQLLERLRGLDWTAEENRMEVRFDPEGMTLSKGDTAQKRQPWSGLTALYETEHIWMLLYGEDQALILQKKDLTAGEPGEFPGYVRESIAKHTAGQAEQDKESIT